MKEEHEAMTIKLDPRESTTEMTDREMCVVLGGLIGALAQLSDVETAQRAVRWWAETDAAWDGIRALHGVDAMLERKPS